MTGRWDDRALSLLREISTDLTSLDAVVEVLRTSDPGNPTVTRLDLLTKRALRRQLDLLAHLKE